MCARYSLSRGDQTLAELFGVADVPPLPQRWNVAPTQTVPVIVQGVDGVRRVVPMRWGLVPSWASDPSVGNRMINARAETAASKPAFREALRARRCIVPADGFFEWTDAAEGRQPLHLRRADRGVFALAGLCDVWVRGVPSLTTFTILTTEPNELVRPVHDRMPVVLDPADYATWLDATSRDPSRVLPLLRPFPDAGWEAIAVSRRVNDPRHDDAECLAPVA